MGRPVILEARHHRLPLILMLLLSVLSLVLLPATPAEARNDTNAEVRFLDSVNAERVQRGLPRLTVASDLRTSARRHSVVMADRSHLHHNPRLGSEITGYRLVAENVGFGPSVASIHRALMNSQGHRENILNPRVTEIGIGVEVRNSRTWVTQVFRQPRSAPTVRFNDIAGTPTHRGDILSLASSGVTMGCGRGSYCPDRPITRAEMATFLGRADGLLPRNPGQFSDTPSSNVHSPNIEAIRHAGLTTGCGDTRRYCPDRNVTRAEMASFLARALDLDVSRSSTGFSDVRNGTTHAGAIEAISRAGLTNGCGSGRYCPDRNVTRAEMASFLVRAFDL
ncbi:MAG: S-layer homology domain-containing protein [Nitriliruptoraceae bacterium]|nr:S-layer homology domain-containing protein [Nitriliruptoraceae bacterium]